MLSLFFILLAQQARSGYSSGASGLTYSDICGSWSEKGGCYSLACGQKSYQVTSYQFSAPGDGSPSFNWTTTGYADDTCDEGEAGLQVGIYGMYTMMGKNEGTRDWTKITYYPSKLSVYLPAATDIDSTSIYSWPDGTCAKPSEYLNTYCPCGGAWEEGTVRTVNLASCPEGSCPAFHDAKWYGNIQKGSPGASMTPDWLGFSAVTTGEEGYEKHMLVDAVAREDYTGCQTLGAGVTAYTGQDQADETMGYKAWKEQKEQEEQEERERQEQEQRHREEEEQRQQEEWEQQQQQQQEQWEQEQWEQQQQWEQEQQEQQQEWEQEQQQYNNEYNNGNSNSGEASTSSSHTGSGGSGENEESESNSSAMAKSTVIAIGSAGALLVVGMAAYLGSKCTQKEDLSLNKGTDYQSIDN